MSKNNGAAKVAASTSASADKARTAKDTGAVEVKIEVGAEVEDILAEMCGSFNGDDEAAKLVRGYADRIRKRVEASNEQAAKRIETAIEKRGGLVKAVEAAMADGVTWDETNTEPACKTFRVEIRFDIADRLKLGMLAARCRETPERFLEMQLRTRFDEMADKVFYGGGKKRTEADEAYSRSFEALYLATLESIVDKKEGRLAFKPAVMA